VHLNAKRRSDQGSFTYLPFLALALSRAIRAFPQVNARDDSARDTLVRYRAVHLGVATQTSDGLKVPVLRRAGTCNLEEMARELVRIAELARTNRAKREDLTGSTITITSLGKLGGIATTPVINTPEVAVLGVNRAVDRAVVRNGQVVARRMMNLSASFDHRFGDGFDAAAFIQELKQLLEHPALLFACS
jgi:2-oxoisovalerate dehydrogenase E2 component (dihydrolipoyl transacylase)